MTACSLAVDVVKVGATVRSTIADQVAIEEPLEIQIVSAAATGAAAKSVSITMRTPGDDPELALGFLLTEGIIKRAADFLDVTRHGDTDETSGAQNIVRIELQPDIDIDFDKLQRHFYTTSSCGVCGKASLSALRIDGQESLGAIDSRFDREMLHALPARVRDQQPLFATTGGLHAAAMFAMDGEILAVREDVGRHNATDKVIGALLLKDKLPAHNCGLLVSGRASFELMQKALVAGIPFLAAVGAPSSLAVSTAAEFGMTLVGFLRDGTFNIYAGEKRISNGGQ